MGYVGCLGWIVGLIFWALLFYGRDDLGPKWTWTLALLWLAGWGIAYLLSGAAPFFMPFVALLDVVLVLAAFQGDLRIS